MMKIIIFCKKGEAVSDFYISQYVDEIFTLPKRIWKICNKGVLDEILARVKEGKINKSEFILKIQIEDSNYYKTIKVSKDGALENYPECLNIQTNILYRILF